MKVSRVLIVEDESSLRTSLFRVFERKNYQVMTAIRCDEARNFAGAGSSLDLALIDLNLPDGDGLELMTWIKQTHPLCQVIILTGDATIENAVKATQLGAFHFLTKPFSLDEVTSLAEKAFSHTQLQQENRILKSQLGRQQQFQNIIGQSSELQSVLRLVEQVADTDSTILISGESGTGKELIARAVHSQSSRAQQPFVAINCGAIPSELLESELFGHVKGAFTGAVANRLGRFELADGGTLFLDEIGDLEPALQVKILRALQERQFEPVGGAKSVSVNVRVIAATNKDLESLVEQGRFREDLFYRLNVIPLNLPALRSRKADIPLLLAHFIDYFNRTKNRKLGGFSAEALQCLTNYSWPGNIRELENLVERLSILKGQGTVEAIDLPSKYQASVRGLESTVEFDLPENGADFNSAVDQFENQLILRALEKTGWNRNQAATLLKLNRTTLVEKMKKKGLRRPGEAMEI